MPNFQDLQNRVLNRVRSRGVNWGGTAGNQPGDFEPPYYLKQAINDGYSQLYDRTQDVSVAPLFISFLSTLNAKSYPLNPILPIGGLVNPSALRVFEATYTPAGTPERPLPIVSTDEFKRITGGYIRRFSNFGPVPYCACQLYNERSLEVFPGTAVAGDTITLKISPAPQDSPNTCPASNGGALLNDSDVPLFPSQFHLALVEWAVYNLLDVKNRGEQRKEALAQFEAYVDQALWYGSANGEGNTEQRVIDGYRLASYDAP